MPYTGTIVESQSAHKYNTGLITQIIHHVTTFKNAPAVFTMGPTKKIKLYRGSDYYVCMDTKKYAIAVEPTAKHIHCETTGKILGYRDLVKMYEPVLKKSMCN